MDRFFEVAAAEHRLEFRALAATDPLKVAVVVVAEPARDLAPVGVFDHHQVARIEGAGHGDDARGEQARVPAGEGLDRAGVDADAALRPVCEGEPLAATAERASGG